MRKIFTLLVLTLTGLTSWSQFKEDVGTPTLNTPVISYTGWSNNTTLVFTGTAEVQDSVQSTGYGSASSGGNVFFNSTSGITLQISNINAIGQDGIQLYFGMYNYDTAHPSDILLQYSINGTTYKTWRYKRLFQDAVDYADSSWDIMVSDALPVQSSNLRIRFTQNSSTREYRIDDINFAKIFLTSNPIKLINFSIYNNNSNITTLNWTANSTSSFDKFCVQKSTNGIEYTDLYTTIAGSEGEKAFSYTDNNTSLSTNTYYRLKLIDINGQISYSQIGKISLNNTSSSLLQNAFPIPANNSLTLQLKSSYSQQANIAISDITGKLIYQENFPLINGINPIPVNIKQLHSTGIYNLLVHTTDGSIATKQIMLK